MTPAMPGAPSTIDYAAAAASYARHREIHLGVLAELVAHGEIGSESRVLDVGCGTGNYARSLVSVTGCRVSGVEPSARMRDRAISATAWEALLEARAEQLPFPDATFDLVMSTDVIHHVSDRNAYFAEAARVLRPGGHVVTVTDSHDDIRRRRPLSSHFPETVPVELARYPSIAALATEMERAGFVAQQTVEVARDYQLTDSQPYRDRAYSSLLLIDDAAFQRGLARLESALALGPIPCVSLYTLLWGTIPAS
jgi:ubiquinone/menaquinone biosynthesis C-methylase UbiE